MAMVLSEELVMLRDSAKGFLGDKAPVSQLRGLRDVGNADGFDRDTWKAMADMGFAGVLVPEDHGGVGMGHLAAGLIAEEMGRTLTASPYHSTAVMGATALSHYGSDAQKDEWLPRIGAGAAITSVAVDESRKHAPQTIATRAERSGNGFKITGEKVFVADASIADAHIVAARTAGSDDEAEGITLFLVPGGASGVSASRKSMVDSRNAGPVAFAGVEVTADAVIGEVDGGARALEHILNAGRAGLAAEMSGAAQECLGRTTDYLKERSQFGAIIGTFQSLQHRAAHLYTEIELGKSIVMQALQALDTDPASAEMMVTAAKAKMGQVAQLAAQEAVQMHGGIGMTDEHEIGFFIKRIRVAEAMLGDTNFHTDKFARLRGY